MDGDLTRAQNVVRASAVRHQLRIGDNLQLKYEVPYSVSGSRDSSFGDTKLGVKFQFYGNDESKTQMAVYPQVLMNTPAKNRVQRKTAPAEQSRLYLLDDQAPRQNLARRYHAYRKSRVQSLDPRGYAKLRLGALGIGAPLAGRLLS